MPYRDVEKQRAWHRTSLNRKRTAWLAEHGPCVKCGSWTNLEVDHVDRSTKVSHCVWSWAPPRREAELAKCQVLCERCHAEKTAEESRRVPQHGAPARYKHHGCRCEVCRVAMLQQRAGRWKKGPQVPPRCCSECGIEVPYRGMGRPVRKCPDCGGDVRNREGVPQFVPQVLSDSSEGAA